MELNVHRKRVIVVLKLRFLRLKQHLQRTPMRHCCVLNQRMKCSLSSGHNMGAQVMRPRAAVRL